MTQQLDFQLFVPKTILTTRRTLGAKEHQLVHREITLIEES